MAEWAREAGPLWPATIGVLFGLGFWILMGWPGWRIGLFVAGVVLVLIGILYELRDRAWRRQARHTAPAAPDATQARIIRDDLGMTAGLGGIQAPQALVQDDYVALLERDQLRILESFVLRVRAARAYAVDDHELEWDCRRCRQRAVTLVIQHPIWDGPRENAGSGALDLRVTPYCPRCDAFTIALAWTYGLEPSPPLYDMLTSGVVTGGRFPGIPVRLPYTGVGAIRLHTALWLRAPFHNLPIQVERAIPPPPAPKDQPHPFYTEATTTTPPPACEVCGRLAGDLIHAMRQQAPAPPEDPPPAPARSPGPHPYLLSTPALTLSSDRCETCGGLKTDPLHQ